MVKTVKAMILRDGEEISPLIYVTFNFDRAGGTMDERWKGTFLAPVSLSIGSGDSLRFNIEGEITDRVDVTLIYPAGPAMRVDFVGLGEVPEALWGKS